jgi:glycerol-3-phosphate dehydrogenase
VRSAEVERDYDVVIVGGGIQGACMLLEATRRGLHAVLLERGVFGGATSANSLRILHGGLRYLQSADVGRMRTSIRERSWFCRQFPDLVRPLPCLMPLRGGGLRSPPVMRAALALNDLASFRRNAGVHPAVHLPRGRVLDAEATLRMVPGFPADGLRGSALWYDALMVDSERLLLEILAWAERLGGLALSGMRVVSSDADAQGISAVHAETVGGDARTFRSRVVINCAGPWTEDVARALGSPAPGLFNRALAFNLLLDCPAPAEAALAVAPRTGGRMLFLVPWEGRLLAGTYHAPWTGPGDIPNPTADQIAGMIADLDRALPGRGFATVRVAAVLAGFMPAARPDGTPAAHPTFFDHGRRGGLRGLHSVVAVKYTTARAVAERALSGVFGRRPVLPGTARDAERRPPSPGAAARPGG